jgi:hypothetical protein
VERSSPVTEDNDKASPTEQQDGEEKTEDGLPEQRLRAFSSAPVLVRSPCHQQEVYHL